MPVFVDTNVLVYARDASEGEKHDRAQAWMTHLWRTGQGRLGFQVLREYYVTTTLKLEPGLEPAEAQADIRNLLAWNPVPDDADLLEAAWDLQDRFSLSFWDALIAAAAGIADCAHLLTEDLQHGQDLDGVRVVNPFRVAPESLELD